MQELHIPREDVDGKGALDKQMVQRFQLATVASRINIHAEANKTVSCGQDAMCYQPSCVSHWSDEAPKIEAAPDPLPLNPKAT